MLFRCTKISRPYPCHSLSTTSIRDNFESKLTLTSLCPSVVGPYQRIKFKRVRQKTTSRPLRTIAPPTLVIKLMSPDRNLHTWFCVRLSRCCQCGLCSDFERKSAAVLPAVYVLTPWQLRRWDQVILDKSYVWHTVVSYARLVPSNAWREGSVPNNMLHQHAIPLLASTSCISLSSLSASLLFFSHFCPTFSWERGLKLGPRSHLVGEAIYHPQLLPAHYYPSPAAQRVITRPARGTVSSLQKGLPATECHVMDRRRNGQSPLKATPVLKLWASVQKADKR